MSSPRTSEQPVTAMLSALVRLHDALQHTRLPLELADVEEARTLQREIVSQLEDYVLPRLVQIDAPLLTVVGGSTGAGKSTLVNSLVGETVTEAGVLRPTTRSPVLVHNPADRAWFDEARILPDFQRTSRASADPGALQLVSSPHVPEGLAILDAPDVDSVEQRNRELAAQLLGAADMWLFVTSAARYADQVPWDFLRQAAERSAAVAVVLDRTAVRAIPEVSAHLTRMLASRGLRDSPLFTVPEADLDPGGLLPQASVEAIQDWLEALAADADARSAIVRQTLGGAIRTIARRTHVVADACAVQHRAADQLRGDARRCYEHAAEEVDRACADGTLLRGEVLARWQEFVGTGEMLKSLESRVGWARDRLMNAVRGVPQPAARVTVAVESGLQTLIVEHAEAAAERAEAAWRGTATGRDVLTLSPTDLSRASRDLPARAERLVRDWQAGVLDMVRGEGSDRRTTARVLAYGVNALAVSLMVVVFAATGGVTGAEVGVAGGSAVLGQRLLEAVFGDQAVRRLAAAARRDLGTRISALLEAEQRRFTDLLDHLGVSADRAEQLRGLARGVDDVRYRQGDGLSATGRIR
ncbi:MAG: dynamin family protein [Marmoricola sp.]